MHFKILITLLTIYFPDSFSVINITWVDEVVNNIFRSSKLYQITYLLTKKWKATI